MPTYIRWREDGATYFFTVVTLRRRRIFAQAAARAMLHSAFHDVQKAMPFDMPGIVLLPDHLHCVWTLSEGDDNFPSRWRRIKELFTRSFLRDGGLELQTTHRHASEGRRGVWQPRYWEHRIRDESDFGRHMDYIHFNPVKHRLATCPHAWPWSTFQRWVKAGVYEQSWYCSCKRRARAPDFSGIEDSVGE